MTNFLTLTVSIIRLFYAKPNITCGKYFILALYDKFYGLDVFRKGTIEHPGLFTFLSLMKIF